MVFVHVMIKSFFGILVFIDVLERNSLGANSRTLCGTDLSLAGYISCFDTLLSRKRSASILA